MSLWKRMGDILTGKSDRILSEEELHDTREFLKGALKDYEQSKQSLGPKQVMMPRSGALCKKN